MIRALKRIPLLLAILLVSIEKSYGQDLASEGAPGDGEPYYSHRTIEEDYDDIDALRESVRSGVFAFTDQIDNFFNDARTFEQRERDFFRVGGQVRFRAAEPPDFRQRLRISLNLRAISDRLRLVAEGFSGDVDSRSDAFEDAASGSDFTNTNSGDSARTALRYSLVRDAPVDIDLDGGVRFNNGVYAFTQVRASRWFDLGSNWSLEPSQFLFWQGDDGFGERSRLDLNKRIAIDMLTRFRTQAVWSEASRGVDLFNELSVVKQLGPRSYIGGYLTLVSYTEPSFSNEEFRTSVRYRRAIGWPWLVGEVEPAMAFPEDRDYRRTPEIALRIDVYLDRIESGSP